MSIVAPTAHVPEGRLAIVSMTVRLPISITDVFEAFVTYAFELSAEKSTPCGLVPVATVATTSLVAVSMIETLPDIRFVTTAQWLSGDTITSHANMPTATFVTSNVARSMIDTLFDMRFVTYAALPSGAIEMAHGKVPTGTLAITE